jgi:seryl-tRNA synthetase
MPNTTEDDPKTPGADADQTGATSGTGDGKDGAGTDSDLSKESPAELARIIAELRKENAATRKKQRELEQAEAQRTAAQKEAEEKRLQEQGEFKTLYEKSTAEMEALKAKAAKAEALEGRIKAANDARIAKVPEAMRTLIPDYDDAVKLSEWLDANLDKLTKPAAPDFDAGKSGERGGQQPITDPLSVTL